MFQAQLDKTAIVDVRFALDAIMARTEDGRIVTWGAKARGGDSSDYALVKMRAEPEAFLAAATQQAFAAMKMVRRSSREVRLHVRKDGSVLAWGAPPYGGDVADVKDVLRTDIIALYVREDRLPELSHLPQSLPYWFLGKTRDGGLVIWQSGPSGKYSGSSRVLNTKYQFQAGKVFRVASGALVLWSESVVYGISQTYF